MYDSRCGVGIGRHRTAGIEKDNGFEAGGGGAEAGCSDAHVGGEAADDDAGDSALTQ
jgi:hypothetical protein